jgi:hypothetical protein
MINVHPDYDLESFITAYQNASTNWSKILLILMIPLFFPFVVVINYTKQKYLTDQLIYTLELVTFFLFVPTILYGFTLLEIVKTAQLFGLNVNFLFYDAYTIWVIMGLISYFLIQRIKKFYSFQWRRILLSAALLIFSTVFVITAYRFILFYVTIKSI